MKTDMEKPGENIDFIIKMLSGFIVIFLMTYGIVSDRITADGADYAVHAKCAMELEWSDFGYVFSNQIPYPLWHFGVNLCVNKLAIDINKAAALITALFNSFAYLSILGIWSALGISVVKKEKLIFWATSLLIVNPLFAPWFNSYYYLGQSAPNVWHSPTNIAVKGFAVVCFGLVLVLINEKEQGGKSRQKYLLLGVMLAFSALAKPAFLQGFIPGLAFFIILRMIMERKKFDFCFYFKLCASFIPAVAIILFQFVVTFVNPEYARTEYPTGIGWGKVLHIWSPNLFFSFLLSFAFPLLVFFLKFKQLICNAGIQLTICYELAAWLEAALLYEGGKALGHGNFIWASLISSFIVWIIMTYYFIQDIYDCNGQETLRKKLLIYGGIPLFMLHLLFGIVYWFNVLTRAINI